MTQADRYLFSKELCHEEGVGDSRLQQQIRGLLRKHVRTCDICWRYPEAAASIAFHPVKG